VSWTVYNDSTFAALADWGDRVYLSDNAILDAGDTLLAHVPISAQTPLAPGDSYTISRQLIIPNTADVGDKFLLFLIDAQNAQRETDELNNLAVRPITLGRPDLTVQAANAPPVAALRESINVSWTVANLSPQFAASAGWLDRVYLSADTTLDGNDRLLATVSISVQTPVPPEGTYNIQRSLTVPLDAAIGGQFLLFVTDASGQQSETDETNNVRAVPIEFTAPDLRVIDLEILQAAPYSGGPLTVRWNALNDGTAPVDRIFHTSLVVRNTETGLTLFSTVVGYDPATQGTIAPGAMKPQQRTLTLPDGPAGAGLLEIRVTTDYYQQIAEGNETGTGETNNLTTLGFVSQLSDYPDLQVRDLAVEPGEGVHSGSLITVNWATFNEGTAAVTRSFRERVVIANADTGQTLHSALLIYDPVAPGNGHIAPGGSVLRTHAYRLPDGAAGAGLFRVTVTTDHLNEVFEYNAAGTAETNNTSQTEFTSVLAAYPDLTVENVVGPRYALPGSSVLVSWETVNLGPASVAGDWTERVFLLNETTGNSTRVGTFRFTGQSLAANERIERVDRLVTLPNGMANGQWRWEVRVDDENQVFETDESNNRSMSDLDVTLPVVLALSAARTRIAENDAPQPVRISRGGSTAEALTVTLQSSDVSELTVPPEVTIPAGQSWVEFLMTPVQDGLADGNQTVTLTARVLDAEGQVNPGYLPTQLAVLVTDTAAPVLLLELSSADVNEGESVTATVTRDVTVFKSEQLIVLSVEGKNQLSLPATVTIPENVASVQFTITALLDDLVEIDRSYRITAQGYGTGQASLLVHDGNRKDLAVTTRDAVVWENAPGLATVGTVTRPVVTSRSQVVALRSSDSSRLWVPATVTIPANRAWVEFPVTTIDNFVAGDSIEVTIAAFCVDPVDQATLVLPGGSTTVLVQDDDSPTLIVTLDRGVISENATPPAALGTVRRNTQDVSQSLLVFLSSSDPTEAVPATDTVEIPAGSNTATFGVNAVEDFVPDGNQIVTITAQAEGFNAGWARVVVTDVDKPDLRVPEVIAPAAGYTDRTVEIAYRVANEGRQPAVGPWVDRVYLSRDAWLDGSDRIAGTYAFTDTIAVGQSVWRTVPVTLPSTVGSFYVIVVTDAGFQVDEILENNNQGFSQAIVVEAAYGVTVSTEIEQANMGTPIPLFGQATLAESGQPAANVPVVVRVTHEDGFVRTLRAFTDGEGQFADVFTPLPNEAGDYQISAAHPGVSNPPSQDSFTLVGMRVLPAWTWHEVVVGQSVTQTMELKNLSGVDLTDVQFTVLDAPGNITVTVIPPAFDLVPGRATRKFPVRDLGQRPVHDASQPEAARDHGRGPVARNTICVAGESSRGPAGRSAVAAQRHAAQPSDAGGIRDPQRRGRRDRSDRRPAAPDGMAPFGLGGRAAVAGARGTTKVSLVLNPAADLPLGPYPGNLVLRSANANPLSIPFTFTAISDATGDLQVTVVNEHTYYAEGSPKVADARVSLVDPFSGTVMLTGETDASGGLTLSDVPEGPYELRVSADGHDTSERARC
jgi:subtilase family serine protease